MYALTRFYGSGSGPGIDGDRFQTLVECVNGDRIACVHPGADGRNRLLGCFQRERRQFMACGLSMDDLAPAAWHHMVILVARGQTTFYIDGEDAGELPTFATTSPILSVGNAVATGEAFGTIADFRVFPRPLNVRERVLNPHAPFNALPWTPSALRGGEGARPPQQPALVRPVTHSPLPPLQTTLAMTQRRSSAAARCPPSSPCSPTASPRSCFPQ